MGRGEQRPLGAEWRILAHEKGDTVEVANRGKLDEVVVDEWFHLEEMDQNQWWMRLGDIRATITKTENGKVRVDIERGSYDEVHGSTEISQAKTRNAPGAKP
jgi:hypothetical protein